MKQQIGPPAIAIAVILVVLLLVFLSRNLLQGPAKQSESELNKNTLKPAFAGGSGTPSTGGANSAPSPSAGGQFGQPTSSGGR